MYVKRALITKEVRPPHLVKKVRPGDNAARIGHQFSQELELLKWKVNLVPVNLHQVTSRVN